MRGGEPLDVRDPRAVPDLVLRNRLVPPQDPEQFGRSSQMQLVTDELDEIVVGCAGCRDMASTADERGKEDATLGRSFRPERRREKRAEHRASWAKQPEPAVERRHVVLLHAEVDERDRRGPQLA